MVEGKVNHTDLRCFAEKLLTAAGTDTQEAAIVADILVWADLVGRPTQGVWRLKELLPKLRNGLIRSPCSPTFIQKTDGIVQVDGHDGLGRYVGHISMAKAIELAGRCGMGLAAVRNSNHYGAGAYYVHMAAQEGMIGFAFTNAPRRVAAHGGLNPLFGTNPIAFSAPMRNGHSVLIDFSTSAMAGSVTRKAMEAKKPIPENVAIDEHGKPVTDPDQAQRFTLLPFGGAKGYCLSLLVEILAGVITGSEMSFQIPSMFEKKQIATRIGHVFLAIDIATLLPLDEYYERIETLVATVKKSTLEPGVSEILIPGETRWKNHAAHRQEGVLLDSNTVESLTSLANELKLTPPW